MGSRTHGITVYLKQDLHCKRAIKEGRCLQVLHSKRVPAQIMLYFPSVKLYAVRTVRF